MKQVRTNNTGLQKPPAKVLPIIIVSQFSGTSLWFAGNAVAGDIIVSMNLPPQTLGYLTSSVQLGFIGGTLLFAFLALTDRLSPVKLFAICSFLAAGSNILAIVSPGLWGLIATRVATGIFLAGIYPVGMKISSDWFGKSLGKALGFLVGALVLGTATPHLIRAFAFDLPWQSVIYTTSGIAFIGGLLMLSLSDGPLRGKSPKFDPLAIARIFRVADFRKAAFGYFGHMWELYAMWAFVPLLLKGDSLLSFFVIVAGTFGCVLGGFTSTRWGSSNVARLSLVISGLSCLLVPFISDSPTIVLFPVLLIWGFFVVSDSPQFSTVVAKTAPKEYVGTALTIVNSIGFAITIPAIELMNYLLVGTVSVWPVSLLAIGPIIGLISMKGLKN